MSEISPAEKVIADAILGGIFIPQHIGDARAMNPRSIGMEMYRKLKNIDAESAKRIRGEVERVLLQERRNTREQIDDALGIRFW